jgi:hypothetical protein
MDACPNWQRAFSLNERLRQHQLFASKKEREAWKKPRKRKVMK